jgi:hypothetical protein
VHRNFPSLCWTESGLVVALDMVQCCVCELSLLCSLNVLNTFVAFDDWNSSLL